MDTWSKIQTALDAGDAPAATAVVRGISSLDELRKLGIMPVLAQDGHADVLEACLDRIRSQGWDELLTSGDACQVVERAIHHSSRVYKPGSSNPLDVDELLERRARALSMVKALVDAGVDPGGSVEGAPLLFIAVEERDLAIAQLLADAGAELHSLDRDGRSLLDVIGGWQESRKSRKDYMDRLDYLRAKAGIRARAEATYDTMEWVRTACDERLVADAKAAYATRQTELARALAGRLSKRCRPCYVPQTEDGPGEDAASRFGGAPFLLADESWPACPSCSQELNFFVQVDLGEIPDEAHHGGELLQLFYCVACSPYKKNATEQLARIVDARSAGAAATLTDTAFAPKRVVSWRTDTDLPHPEELGRVKMTDDERRAAFRLNLQGDKVGGWPNWVQRPSHPKCGQCKKKMKTLLLQIDSNRNVDYAWGDNGVGFVFQCSEHKDDVAFRWEAS